MWGGHNIVGAKRIANAAGNAIHVTVVDKVQELVGGTCTIFQRMNDTGDMLRVSTNVEKLDGTRAIGTFIPAINPIKVFISNCTFDFSSSAIIVFPKY